MKRLAAVLGVRAPGRRVHHRVGHGRRRSDRDRRDLSPVGNPGPGRHRRASRRDAGRRPRQRRRRGRRPRRSRSARSTSDRRRGPGAVDQLHDRRHRPGAGQLRQHDLGAGLGDGGRPRACSSGRPARWACSARSPTRAASPSGCRRPAGCWAAPRSTSSPTRSRPGSRTATNLRYAVTFVDDVYGRSVAEGAFAAIERRGLTDVGHFALRLPNGRHASARAEGGGREARRPVRLRLPRGRDRAATPARRASTCRWSRTSARPPATACRRSGRPWARTRSASTPRTSRPPPRSIPSGLLPDGATLLRARQRRLPRTLGRGHEPRGARRVLGGVGVVHRRAAAGDLDVGCRRRRGGARLEHPSGQPAERERPAVRRARAPPKPATTSRRRA